MAGTKERPYRPSIWHYLGLCMKSLKGYNCYGHKGECGELEQ